MLAASLAVISIGIFMVYTGFKIQKKGTVSFIAGYNEVFTPKNEQKLAGRIGLAVSVFGVTAILFPVVYQFVDGVTGVHFAILAGINILFVFIFMMFDQMEM